MIVQGQTASFKGELYNGLHVFVGVPTITVADTFMLALYTGNANLDSTTTIYTNANEVVDPNYVAGGAVISGITVLTANNVAYINANNVTWTGVSFIARGALIYNATKGNRAVAVLDFGRDIQAGPNFVVQMPANYYATALIRSQ